MVLHLLLLNDHGIPLYRKPRNRNFLEMPEQLPHILVPLQHSRQPDALYLLVGKESIDVTAKVKAQLGIK